MKRMVEIDDTLKETVEAAIEDIKSHIDTWHEENSDVDELPDWGDLDHGGRLTEICDSAVPVYDGEIADMFYLHGDDIERAFDDAGFEREGEWPRGWKAAAIMCYIQAQAQEWLQDEGQEYLDELTQGEGEE